MDPEPPEPDAPEPDKTGRGAAKTDAPTRGWIAMMFFCLVWPVIGASLYARYADGHGAPYLYAAALFVLPTLLQVRALARRVLASRRPGPDGPDQ